MASRILDALVPRFADAAGLYALEQLLSDATLAGPLADAGPARRVVRRLATRSAPGAQFSLEAFPSGEVVALGADSPVARSLREGAPVIFTRVGSGALRRLSPQARKTVGRYTSFIAAPMTTRDTTVGTLVLARAQGAPPFRDGDTQAALDLAVRAAAAVADSLALMRRRSVAEALRPPRRSVALMPHTRLEVAGRCLPATGCDAGCDWYDIIPLPGGRTGLVVGDVMGHGPLAATVMTRLSAAAYTLADLDLPPAEVMRQLNRTAITLPHDTLATCAYAVIDPARQSCVITTAGHLPPVLAMPGGMTRVIDMPGGQSLGIAPASYGQARIRLRPGTVLALYTDGLVETRSRPYEQGIVALRSALAEPYPDLDATCESLTPSSAEACEDDMTIVLARIPPGPAF